MIHGDAARARSLQDALLSVLVTREQVKASGLGREFTCAIASSMPRNLSTGRIGPKISSAMAGA